MTSEMTSEMLAVSLETPETLLKSWQGHRRLTRKTIEAFPEEKLFEFSLGGMRTYGHMVLEMIGMTGPVVEGVLSGMWTTFNSGKVATKKEVLALWDEQTMLLQERFPKIPEARFWAMDKAFGQWEMPGIVMIRYAIDNEIHHRGEGYVYLRVLGIEPPAFYDRN
ncbi:DinB family protein [Granulicella tundricola]|uniref:DinB family protein n=1 Tax=Granulicella tundricola (strain ATCC BAA-1859 / DSM 23138 / MP5ACTX9) TaxID=1198114 RepID=E8WZQ5_GRATM|nr:DinB family protein [Granulicella tundricola]ADW70029.1 DinB family protein [Granulicella tundricola MP5ACTX9]